MNRILWKVVAATLVLLVIVSFFCRNGAQHEEEMQIKAQNLFLENLAVVDEFLAPNRTLNEDDFRRLDNAVDRLELLTGITSGTDSPYGRIASNGLIDAAPRWKRWYSNNRTCIYYCEALDRIVIHSDPDCTAASEPMGIGASDTEKFR
jgi:hypothetical protein